MFLLNMSDYVVDTVRCLGPLLSRCRYTIKRFIDGLVIRIERKVSIPDQAGERSEIQRLTEERDGWFEWENKDRLVEDEGIDYIVFPRRLRVQLILG